MPIHKMSLEGEIFTTRSVGYMDNSDGKMWANALRNHAADYRFPVPVVIDMVEVDRLCPTIPRVIQEALKNGDTSAVGIVISDSMASQNARAISKLSEIPGVRVFATAEDAHRFVLTRPAAISKGGWNTMTVTAFSFAGSF